MVRLSLCYPQAKRTPEELEVLCDIWFEDLCRLSNAEFLGAVKDHRTQSEFFPTIAEINKRAAEFCRQRDLNRPRLPAPRFDLSEDGAGEIAALILNFRKRGLKRV
jgi:hypothetical protein